MFRSSRLLTLAFGLYAVWPAVARAQTMTPVAPSRPPTPTQVTHLFGGQDPVPVPPLHPTSPSSPYKGSGSGAGGWESTLLPTPTGARPGRMRYGTPVGVTIGGVYFSSYEWEGIQRWLHGEPVQLTPEEWKKLLQFIPREKLESIHRGESSYPKQAPQVGQGGQFTFPYWTPQTPGGQYAQRLHQGQQVGWQSPGGLMTQRLGQQFGGQLQGGQYAQHFGQGQQFGGQIQGGQYAQHPAQGQQFGGQTQSGQYAQYHGQGQ